MRIALIGPAPPYKGGGALHTAGLARRLRAAGHEVRVESWRAQYPGRLYPGVQTVDDPATAELEAGVSRQLAWYSPLSWWRVGRRSRSWADLVVFAVLTPIQVPAYLVMLRAAFPTERSRRKVRAVALCHNITPHEPRPFDERLIGALLRRADGVLVHSVSEQVLACGLTDRPVRMAELPPLRPRTSRPLPAPAQPFQHLLFFGMVRPYKGLDILLRALGRPTSPSVRLTVAGEFWGGTGPTERLVAELGLQDRVTIRPGYVPEEQVGDLFAGVDALVLPYRSATSSAMAWIGLEHGVPVITTTAGSLADAVTDGVNGLVCRAGDVHDLACALERFYRPGVALGLRSRVRPVDSDQLWRRYLEQVLSFAG